jgi:predicted lactoylglutathione lyase
MSSIDTITLEVDDLAAAERFYHVLGVSDRVRLRASATPTSGFRGFTLSLVCPQPGDVNLIVKTAVDAGATETKPASRSLWGYGGAFRAPDGTLWTIASSAKKDTGPATGQVDSFVLLLGVADVKASKQFYVGRGLSVGKSFGSKYVEFEGTGPIGFGLNKRKDLAKNAGVDAEGSGSHRLVVNSSLGEFTDPDGFAWGPA